MVSTAGQCGRGGSIRSAGQLSPARGTRGRGPWSALQEGREGTRMASQPVPKLANLASARQWEGMRGAAGARPRRSACSRPAGARRRWHAPARPSPPRTRGVGGRAGQQPAVARQQQVLAVGQEASRRQLRLVAHRAPPAHVAAVSGQGGRAGRQGSRGWAGGALLPPPLLPLLLRQSRAGGSGEAGRTGMAAGRAGRKLAAAGGRPQAAVPRFSLPPPPRPRPAQPT